MQFDNLEMQTIYNDLIKKRKFRLLVDGLLYAGLFLSCAMFAYALLP